MSNQLWKPDKQTKAALNRGERKFRQFSEERAKRFNDERVRYLQQKQSQSGPI